MTDPGRYSRTENLTVLEVVQRYAPRPYKTHMGSEKGRYTMPCPLHDDAERPGHSGSFSVHADNQRWKCFGGCGGGGSALSLQKRLAGLDSNVQPPPVPRSPRTRKHRKSRDVRERPSGCTLRQLCDAKFLSEKFVRQELGWRDAPHPYISGLKAVQMPYTNVDNGDWRARYRQALKGNRFIWERGAKLGTYGLWRLCWIKANFDYVFFVEGETSFAMLAQHGFPVLAVPGADTWPSVRSELLPLLEGLTVYLFQDPDQGGEGLARHMGEDLLDLKLIRLPEDLATLEGLAANHPNGIDSIQDPCDLYPAVGANFPEVVEQLRRRARLWWAPPEVPWDDGWAQFSLLEQALSVPNCNGAALDRVHTKVERGLRAQGKETEADKVADCGRKFRARKWDSGQLEGVPYHCYQKGCPECRLIKLTQFMKEKAEEMDALTDPAIYLVSLGARYVSTDPDAMRMGFLEVYEYLNTLDKAYARRAKRYSWVGANHIYNLRMAIRSGWALAQLALLSNYEEGAAQTMEELFNELAGHPVKVEVLHSDVNPNRDDPEKHKQELLGTFRRLVATSFSWDTDTEYLAWSLASRGRKLLQGKGIFHKASGGENPRPRDRILVARKQVRDTAPQIPSTLVSTQESPQGFRFKIDNRLDEPLAVTLIGSDTNDSEGAVELEDPIIVPVGGKAVVLGTGAPWLGVRVKTGMAPSSGDLTVKYAAARTESGFGGVGVNPFTGQHEGWTYLVKLTPKELWEPFNSPYTGRRHWRPKAGVDVLAFDPGVGTSRPAGTNS